MAPKKIEILDQTGELLKAYTVPEGKDQFEGVVWEGVFLYCAQLSGANFKGADLYWAGLCMANLDGANFEKAQLQ